jgi:hypothetical protein
MKISRGFFHAVLYAGQTQKETADYADFIDRNLKGVETSVLTSGFGVLNFATMEIHRALSRDALVAPDIGDPTFGSAHGLKAALSMIGRFILMEAGSSGPE